MKQIFKNLKKNNGSITTVVLITVLFFLTILSTAYFVTATIRKSQLKSEIATKKVYEDEFNNIDEIINELKKALKVGDYVDYTYDTATAYSLTATVSGYDTNQTISQPDTALKWRILSINDDGTIDLVSSEATDASVYLNGSLGYNNGVYTLNNICAKLFSNTSLGVTARNIALEDIESKMNLAGIDFRNLYEGSGTIQYGNIKTYEGNYSYYPKLYASQMGAGINTTTVTQPDIAGVNPYKESSNGYTTSTTETYGQASTSGLTVTQTYYYMSSPSTYFDDNTAYSIVFGTGSPYWLASRYSSCDTSYGRFGLRSVSNSVLGGNNLYYSNNDTNAGDARLRPVVSLNSDVIDIAQGKNENGAWEIK